MELEEFMRLLERLIDDHGLYDEGCTVKVNGVDVTGVTWDGNTTINIEVED